MPALITLTLISAFRDNQENQMNPSTKREIQIALRRLNKIYDCFDTWERVAMRLGIPARTIRKWFSGEIHRPSPFHLDCVRDLAHRLGIR